MIAQILQYEIPITDTYSIGVVRSIAAILLVVLFYFIYRYTLRFTYRVLRNEKGDVYDRKVKVIFKYAWIFTSLYIIAAGLQLHNFSLLSWVVDEFEVDWDITSEGFQIFKIGSILLGLLLIQVARFCDLLISKALERNLKSRDKTKPHHASRYGTEEDVKRKINHTVQLTVYAMALLLLMSIFNLDATIFSGTGNEDKPGLTLKISDLVEIVVILFLARLIISLMINILLRRTYKSQNVDQGRQYSFNQLFSYFIYVVAVFVAINSLGYNMTLVLGGLAALLVGVGIGLQQTFNDFFSGIILLFEHSVEVGNILEIEGEEFGEVIKIGLRTSVIRNRNNIIKIIPNSLIVNGTITNLSHMDNKSRFYVELAVAYDTDLKLLENIMLDVASHHEDVLPYPQPQVFFQSIASSTFNFRLYFWSTKIMPIQSLKSALRWELINQCRRHQIEVAYDQLDVRFRNTVMVNPEDQQGMRVTPLSPDKDVSQYYKNDGEEE